MKMSALLPTWLAAETPLADPEFLQVAANKEEFQKLRIKPPLLVISKSDGQQFKQE